MTTLPEITEEQFRELLERYRLGQCTDDEIVLLESWYIEQTRMESSVDLPTEQQVEKSWQKVLGLSGLAHRRRLVRIRNWSAAAAVLLFIVAGGGYFYFHGSPSGQQRAPAANTEIVPGGDKAILTLADGKTISLADVKKGTLTIQGSARVTKTADGKLVYGAVKGERSAAGGQGATLLMNSVTTPRGGQYHLVLADGTNAWLNAASSINYPAIFTEKERRVTVTGEVYFEVAFDKARPFRVEAGDQIIDVRGTHFNVNVYADEPVHKTTLLEGSVKVTRPLKGSVKKEQQVVLSAGQQARTGSDATLSVMNKVDLEVVMGWKQGDFVFNSEDIRSIMRNIARWYDVDVSYQGTPGPLQFDGIVSRQKKISAVLEIIEATGKIHFKIEKRRLMVITTP